jgi:hypothetical protein
MTSSSDQWSYADIQMLGDRAGRECLGEIASDDEDAEKDDFVLPPVRWAHLKSALSKFKPAHEETDPFQPTSIDNRRPPTTTVLSPAAGNKRQHAQTTSSTSQAVSTKSPPSIRTTSSLKRVICVSDDSDDDEDDNTSKIDFDDDCNKCPTCRMCKDNKFNLAQHIEKQHQPLNEVTTTFCESILNRKLRPPPKKKSKN